MFRRCCSLIRFASHTRLYFKTITPTRAVSFIQQPRYILNMEWDQLSRERSILDMPFLDDGELPFLRQFDNHPEVSIEKVLDILQPTSHSTSENTREHYHAASHTDPGAALYTTSSANPGQSIMNE
ncbi:hypothetical protein KCU65_g329, partial [Aureobasidium melanogenum]